MVLSALSGICKATAVVTGLLLVYGIVYAMEGMTTRIPTNPLHELAVTTLWTLPWTLLFCSGLEDFVAVTRQGRVLWVGMTLALAFLYYSESHTTIAVLTKAAMPLLATVGGLLPHAFPRIRFVFTVFSLAAGIAGVVVLYFAFATLLSPASSFVDKPIGFVIFAFGTAALATGLLSVASLRPARSR